MSLPPSHAEIKKFIHAISLPKHAGMFNPWSERSDSDLDFNAHNLRQERLFRHLSAPNPQLVLIGEAAGYQGCRFSGIPFTSERLICEGKIPRINTCNGARISSRTRPWSEPSATIVWRILDALGLTESTVLSNAVPWHPEGKRGPLSNRTPTSKEKGEGLHYLKHFLSLFPNIPIAALGNIASGTLTELSIAHTKVRHPAYGGATKFSEGLRQLMNGSV